VTTSVTTAATTSSVTTTVATTATTSSTVSTTEWPNIPLYYNATAPQEQYYRALYLEILKAYVTTKQQYNILASGNFSDYNQVLQIGSTARSSVVFVLTNTGGGGTGFFITGGGCIVTNQHVVAGAKSITVQLVNGTVLRATLLKQGNFPDVDLALLKVNGSSYPSVTITDAIPASGDTVFIVGHPAEFGQWVISSGNFISYAMLSSSTQGPLGTLLFSAPIGPGSSGSPLITTDGRVIGVNKGNANWLSGGITASDNIIVDAKNAGYYWMVGPYQNTAVPSSTLLNFLQGTACEPSTVIHSTASSQTFSMPQVVTTDDVMNLYANYTALVQNYENLASGKSQSSQYGPLLNLASKTKSGVVAIYSVYRGSWVTGAATGFVVSPNGCIVTNRHVASDIVESGMQIGVELVNGTKFIASVIKVANQSGPDLAVLKVNGSGFNALPVSPATPPVGATVFTIGNPTRFGMWVISAGRFAWAGVDLGVSMLKSSLPGGEGNSGSPMLNLNGAVVGVVFGGMPGNSSLGPSDNVVVWMDNAGGYYVRGTYVSAVPSQALVTFLKDTPCQATISQSLSAEPSQSPSPVPAVSLSYLIAVWLLPAPSEPFTRMARKVGNRTHSCCARRTVLNLSMT
jgi:S1-C subfamily serine protease